jgi:hypothetical protein
MYPIWGTFLLNQSPANPMSKSAMVRARLEPELKEHAEQVFKKTRFKCHSGNYHFLQAGRDARRFAGIVTDRFIVKRIMVCR